MIITSHPNICSISMSDITSPVAWFTVCLEIMEDFQNPIHGTWGPFKGSSRAAGTNASSTGHSRTGFNPTTTRCRVIVVGFQVGRRRHI